MKIIIKCILGAIVTFSFVNIPIQVKATEKVIEINKDNKFLNENSEILINGIGILPGDSVKEKITLKNSSNSILNIKLESKSIVENDMLGKITINITHRGKLIYNGLLVDINERRLELGTYNPKAENELIIIASLDGNSVGNEYQNKSEEFNLIFTIVGDNPNNNDESTKGKEPNNIPQTGLPLKATTFIFAFLLIGLGLKALSKK
ncbi:hypothetical protein [Clostridium sp.]|uniref:hypothetical protein n=1 Tax=Clostridium sp. TaxID=1506 RepID=UPI002FCC65A8